MRTHRSGAVRALTGPEHRVVDVGVPVPAVVDAQEVGDTALARSTMFIGGRRPRAAPEGARHVERHDGDEEEPPADELAAPTRRRATTAAPATAAATPTERRAPSAGPSTTGTRPSSSRTEPHHGWRRPCDRRSQLATVATRATTDADGRSPTVPGDEGTGGDDGGEEADRGERCVPGRSARDHVEPGRRVHPGDADDGGGHGRTRGASDSRGRRGPRRRRAAATSRLSHDVRRPRKAFQAIAGRPRCSSAPAMPAAASAAAKQPVRRRRRRSDAHADGELAEEREPHERPVGVLGPEVPVARRERLDGYVGGQLDAGRRDREVRRRQLGARRRRSGRRARPRRRPARR